MENSFDQKLKKAGQYPLKANRTDTFVVNFGLIKNLQSMYYYSEAAQERMNEMPPAIIEKTLSVLEANPDINLVEITGSSPEIHPRFKHFIKSASSMGKTLAVVTNPAVYAQPGMEDMPEFLAEHKVKILAFVPHYEEAVVDRYTKPKTYKDIVFAFKKLNSIGYSREGSSLTTAFVYLPAEPRPAGNRESLRQDFIKGYKELHNIHFNHFIVFNTIPIGRFNRDEYINALMEDFNPPTLNNLPCRHAVSIAPDGRLFDCDFLVAADRPVRSKSNHVDNFDHSLLKNREIATSDLCFICTAGEGATCAECFT